jgi:N-acyl-phosphatidylethanolamine-hydrolysing phospholipase D
VSPVSWAGPRRVHPPGVALDSLPRIDAILLSHDHYDHCDFASLQALALRHDAVFVAPLQHRDILSRAGARRIVELDWWRCAEIPSDRKAGSQPTVTLTPSKHWSKRFGTPRNHRLWGGFFLNLGRKTVWFVGDTGYDGEIFRSVRQKCGAPDLALVPIGAYEPRWFMAAQHMNPAEAVQAHKDLAARRSLGIHWGTFSLTDEALDQPPRDLAAARAHQGVKEEDFFLLPIGGTWWPAGPPGTAAKQ